MKSNHYIKYFTATILLACCFHNIQAEVIFRSGMTGFGIEQVENVYYVTGQSDDATQYAQFSIEGNQAIGLTTLTPGSVSESVKQPKNSHIVVTMLDFLQSTPVTQVTTSVEILIKWFLKYGGQIIGAEDGKQEDGATASDVAILLSFKQVTGV